MIEKGGGIHRFINRNMPIITDSGGFQVFSLAYGGVADERLERLGVLLAAELLDEVADVGEVAELELHHLVAVGREAELLGRLLTLGDVAARHDDEVIAALDESLGGVEAEAGGGERFDRQAEGCENRSVI